MTVSPAGSLSLSIVGAKNILAKSATLQAYMQLYHSDAGGASEANAKKHIFVDDLFSPLQDQADLRPFCLVTTEEHFWRAIADCGEVRMGAGGGVAVGFFDTARFADVGDNPADDTEGTDDHDDAYINFTNWLGQAIDDIGNGLITSDNWHFGRVEIVDPPTRSEIAESQVDDFFSCWLLFSHDLGD